jgi:hypothetical protein
VIYPTERDIQEFMDKLPQAIKDEMRPFAEAAQREYRRVRLQHPGDEEKLIGILANHASDVFKTLAAKRLKDRSGDFEAFRQAIGAEGGDWETALWFAHDLYRLSGDGRMLAIWHRQLGPKVWVLVRQAEDMWWLPDVVVSGWEPFIGERPGCTSSSDASLPDSADFHEPANGPEANRQRRAQARTAFIEPILTRKGWSDLDLAHEADVDYKTVRNFLDGAAAYRSTRLKLARALVVPVEQLPE